MQADAGTISCHLNEAALLDKPGSCSRRSRVIGHQRILPGLQVWKGWNRFDFVGCHFVCGKHCFRFGLQHGCKSFCFVCSGLSKDTFEFTWALSLFSVRSVMDIAEQGNDELVLV